MLECTHTKKDKEVDLEVDEEMDEDVDENVGEELDDVYFQTCEARVCQSVHTEGRDPRLQLLCQLNGLSANHTQLLRNTCKVNVYIL